MQSELKQGFLTEPVPVSAYDGSKKILKGLQRDLGVVKVGG